ncbi:MAG: hypothetical protein VW258_03760 [Thalassolituus sp.]
MNMYNKAALAGVTTLLLCACGAEDNQESGTGVSNAVAGSTAALAFQNGNFVLLDDHRIVSYLLPEDAVAQLNDTYSIPDAETIFPEGEERLYIGSEFGVTILDIDADGEFTFIGEARHVASCDPVITDGTTMYVTLRVTNSCNRTTGRNSLNIYDIEDPASPVQLSSLELSNPYGLAKLTIQNQTETPSEEESQEPTSQEEQLWVCTDDGLTKVDVNDPAAPEVVTSFPEILCNDIIIHSANDALLTGNGEVSLIDLSSGTPVIMGTIEKGD